MSKHAHLAYNDRSTDCAYDVPVVPTPPKFLRAASAPPILDLTGVRIVRLPAGYAKGARRAKGGACLGAQATGAACDDYGHHAKVREWGAQIAETGRY